MAATEIELDEIREMARERAAGMTYWQIAMAHYLYADKVSRLLAEHGFEARRPRKRVDPEQKRRVCELYAGGLSIRNAAELAGVSAPTARDILCRNNVPRRRRGQITIGGPGAEERSSVYGTILRKKAEHE